MSQNRLRALLGERSAVFDGGYGWLLAERGLPVGTPAELWNVERPEVIGDLHEEYAAAGARILTTNTFSASRPRLAASDVGDRGAELNLAGARLAREVADRHDALVAGDVGPTGDLLEPLGTLTREDAEVVFAEQITALRQGGVDMLLVETMSDLGEAMAAATAAHRVAPDLPMLVTLSFDTNLRTMMGVSPAAAVARLAEAGADAVGANCGRGPGEMLQVAADLVTARRDSDLLVVAQTNAGLPQVSGDSFVYDVDPAALAVHARELRDMGVDVVGSCCGSGPEHTRAIARALSGS